MSEKTSYILHGPKDEYDIPKESLGKTIFNRLNNLNTEDVINIDAKTKTKVLRCGELLETSKKYCDLYKRMGVEKGDVISIVSENSVDYFVPVIAGFYMGIAVNPVNPAYSVGELQRCLLIAQPRLIFTSDSVLDTILRVKDEMKLKTPVLLINSASRTNPYVKCADDLLQENDIELKNFTPMEFDYTNQVALLLFSSGTTGLPKGVMLTHQNLRLAVGLCSHPKYGNVIPGDVNLIIPPFYHIYGSLIQLIGLITSTVSVIMDKFVPKLFFETIQEYKVSKLYAVPSLLLFLSQTPLIKDYNLSSITEIFVGGAPLSKELLMQIYKQQPSAVIKQLYGMTEVAGPCTIQNDKNKFNSVGCLGAGIMAKVINPETREPLGPNQVGEICFKGAALMKGYVPTQEFLDENGFYMSGDAGYYDNDGFFYIVDRYKELIKHKGFQVPPAELESIILTYPAVKDCGVVGIPNERAGEVPLAFVALKENTTCTEKEIVDFVAERISVQKRLYGGVRFVKEIPKNSNGKIMRRTLRELI
ncbi:hypothetical protein ILUMI_26170 [Ignelater luminosus]|uniref:Luciferin 4-monooxygenase n=1 Tax=Ignelater luminosus TaxID=2038154 RepID=A0A8K0C918_IGNLU|nr:hypothetical protein ILUMI_26170 [Ignelater luminosus]